MNLRRVILLSTAAPDRPHGSMVRYGQMVCAALRRVAPELAVETLDLAPTQARLERLPGRIQTPVRYLTIAARARRLLRQPAGLLHLLDGSHAYFLQAVRNLRQPLVVTVHDLIPALRLRGELGRGSPGLGGGWLVRQTLAGLARADAWIADSQCTCHDLVRLAGVAASTVQRVNPAIQAAAAAGPAAPSASPYILHVAGNNTFYKNRAGVIEIFRIIRQTAQVNLKMAGAPPDAALLRKAETSGVGNAIEFLPDLSEVQLAELYRGAALLLFPSLYEGFGWPPLEAMGQGCPVVCSDAGSLPEIAGEAALMAPPHDVVRLAHQAVQVLQDGGLRRRLVEAGFRRVREFTLEAMGAGIVQAYEAAEERYARRRQP